LMRSAEGPANMRASMRSRLFFVALAAVVVLPVSGVSGQSTIGTDPSASSTLMDAGNNADWRSQTFVALAPYLNSLSFWFNGGTLGTSSDEAFYSRLYINTGLGFFAGPELYEAALDQSRAGRYDFTFGNLAVTPGASYTFSVFTNNCGTGALDACPVPVTGTWSNPLVDVTTTDAYAGGYLIDGRNGPDASRDMRFQATFGVPEPATGLLLLVGLLALGGIVTWRDGRWRRLFGLSESGAGSGRP